MRNDYTTYLYHGRFFNSDGSKKDHKYISREKVNGTWRYIYKEVKDTAYKTIDKITGGKLTEQHNRKFDAHMVELKEKRENGYAEAAKAKEEAAQKKLLETKKEVELTKRQNALKVQREIGYAQEARQKEKESQARLKEVKSEVKTKEMNEAANRRSESQAADAKDKYRREHNKKEVDQNTRSEWARKASDTYFDLSNLNRIDPKDVDTTINETSKINPDYDPSDVSTSHNCGFCATAWVLRKKGYDVEAKHDDENATWNDIGDSKTGISDWDAANMFVDLSKVEINEKYGTSSFFNYVYGADKRYKVKYDGYYRYFNSIDEIVGKKEDNKRASYLLSPDVNNVYDTKKNREKTSAEVEQDILQNSKDGDYGVLTVGWKLGGGHALNYQVENGKVIVYDGQVNETYSLEDLYKNSRKINYINCTNLVPTDNVNLVVQNRRKG